MTNTPDLLNEDDVRALLNGTPAPQVGVDLEAAMRTGRRMSARRGAATVTSGAATVALVAALVVVVSKADAPQRKTTGPAATSSHSSASTTSTTPASVNDIKLRCPMTPLAKPAGAAGLNIDAVDPSGRYVSGHAMDTSDNFTSVLWVDGAPTYLRFADSVYVKSINSQGVAVGDAGSDRGPGWNFRYANGNVTELQVPAGWRAYGNVTINERGDIADTIQPEDKQPEGASKGIVWKAGSTSPTIVPLPPYGQVFAITADSRLLGNIGDGRMSEGYLWDLAGNGIKLTRPDGFPVVPEAAAGIYATGRLGGRVIPRWDITTNRLTRFPSVLDGVNPPAGVRISATGWITDGLQVAYRPDGTAVRMAAPGTNEVVSAGVTDKGDVFGTYYTKDAIETYTPAIWHCGSAT